MLHLAKRTMATLSGAGKRVVIVGGVAGGASAAARLRRNDESAHIHIYERGPHVSFANCGLPYYVGNVIKEQKSLLLVTPQFFKQRFNIDVHVDSHVVDVDPKAKTVTVVKGGEQTVKDVLLPTTSLVVRLTSTVSLDRLCVASLA
eukprot:Colp12_sorted_trinity150504_noHs@32560